MRDLLPEKLLYCSICLIIMVCGICAAETGLNEPGPDVMGIMFDDLMDFPSQLVSDGKEAFLKPDNQLILMLAAGASIAMNNTDADHDIANNFEDHHFLNSFFDETFNIVGSPATHFAAAGLWYVSSVKSGDDLNKGRSLAMLRALSLTGITTLGLKGLRGNYTPNGNHKWAWPSGHTSSSFAIASVLDEFYGPEIGIPAYFAAGFVGYRMMESGDHWASDVVFGAVLGWVIGHSVASEHLGNEVAGFEIQPYFGKTTGVNLVKRF